MTIYVLGAMLLIGVYQSQTQTLLSLKSEVSILTGAANIILVYFVFALLVERACEVAMDLLTAAGLVSPKDASSKRITDTERRAISVLLCLVFSIIISLAGLRLVEMILVFATDIGDPLPVFFKVADALLTTLILAGGSDGIHQILRSLLGEKTPLPNED